MKPCRHCMHRNAPDATICLVCSRPLVEPTAPVKVSATVQAAEEPSSAPRPRESARLAAQTEGEFREKSEQPAAAKTAPERSARPSGSPRPLRSVSPSATRPGKPGRTFLIPSLVIGAFVAFNLVLIVRSAMPKARRTWTEASSQTAAAVTAGQPTRYVNTRGMAFVLIPAGRTAIGSGSSDPNRRPDEVLHEVQLSRPFYLKQTEVTQAEWVAVMGTEPSAFEGAGSLPVENVTWFEAVRFCNRLSQLEGLPAAYEITDLAVTLVPKSTGYRLPTEAEWEHACRAGTRSTYWISSQISSEDENFDGRSFGGPFLRRTTEVASYDPNPFGLYDLHGNVAEWCWDYYEAAYEQLPTTDPLGPPTGRERVYRGGAWEKTAQDCRSSTRHSFVPGGKRSSIGFRPARLL